MSAVFPRLLMLALGLAASLLVACGDRSSLIPTTDAQRLNDSLSSVDAALAAGDCAAAAQALAQVRGAAELIPSAVDRRLRKRINEGVRALEQEAPTDCQEAQTTTVETQPPVTTAPPETTAPPVTTAPPQTIPPETVPPQTTPPEGGDGAGTGGAQPPPEDEGG